MARASASDAVAVILAAGAGTRLGMTDQPKAFVPIGGRPMLAMAALAAAAAPAVRSLVVVAPAGWEDLAEGCVEFCGCPTTVVTGGSTRQASVRAALAAVDAEVSVVVIHDAARPFASPDLFTAAIEALDDQAQGVIPVVPVTDTVKHVQEGTVVATLDREHLGLAQTPQAFSAEVLRTAHGRAHEADLLLTDDAAVLELAGFRVRAILGDPMNTKITTFFDLAQAEARVSGIDA
jgi:2-C-methyl-D-erythritol 4-phosphate cytidylyltransferase